MIIFAIKLSLHVYYHYPIWYQEIKCMLKRRENIGGKSSIMIVEYNLRVSENEYKISYHLKWWQECIIIIIFCSFILSQSLINITFLYGQSICCSPTLSPRNELKLQYGRKNIPLVFYNHIKCIYLEMKRSTW